MLAKIKSFQRNPGNLEGYKWRLSPVTATVKVLCIRPCTFARCVLGECVKFQFFCFFFFLQKTLLHIITIIIYTYLSLFLYIVHIIIYYYYHIHPKI